MKYGKEFQQILDASDFPDDWKTSAIEYRKLKKLIKNVAAELEGMGLPPSVLQRLLVTDAAAAAAASGATSRSDSIDGGGVRPGPLESGDSATPMSDTDSVFEFEFDLASGAPLGESESPKKVLVDPVVDDDRPLELDPRDSDASAAGLLARDGTHRFRLRMLSNGEGALGSDPVSPFASAPETPLLDGYGAPRPVGVAEMLRAGGDEPPPVGSPAASSVGEARRIVHRAGDKGSVLAQYVLAGDEANPEPQIRLHVANFDAARLGAVTPTDTTVDSPASTHDELPSDGEDDGDDDGDGPLFEAIRQNQRDRLPAVPPSPALLKMRAVASPIWAIANSGNADGMAQLSLGEAVDPELDDVIDITTPVMAVANGPSVPPAFIPATALNGTGAEGPSAASPQTREFIIPLQSDVAFFNVLTAALKSLSEFHSAQQDKFHEAVDNLCQLVSQSIKPGDSPIILPTPPNTAAADGRMRAFDYRSKSASVNHKDLYVWRQIFSLWIESEIFESSAERDRGERTVAEAERRLQVFAKEVVKRGLGDRRTLRGRRTRKAWDEFLRLNMLLLDLKRFQMANINAARKILKKHDKRTALTASTGLATFVRGTIATHVDKDGHVSTWTFYNTSLPHVLLASLTTTLLPILPSLDDYSCLICMSIAFKPIRLSCGHLFCVRCLVKMQQRRKESCPLCRAPTVLVADKSCLDTGLMTFMNDWFPKEVREKQRENTAEIAKEQLEDAGFDTRCVVM